jgi:hypothetical protein
MFQFFRWDCNFPIEFLGDQELLDPLLGLGHENYKAMV